MGVSQSHTHTHTHFMVTDTRTFIPNFSEQSGVTVVLNNAGHLKFARDEEERGRTRPTMKQNARLIQADRQKAHNITFLHEYFPSFIIPSLESKLSENDSGYWKTRTFAPAEEEPARRRSGVSCDTKCRCYAQTLFLIISH